MDILSNFYTKTVAENERNLRFWEDYLKSLKELDFKTYSDKLTLPVLVPIGSRILFRGELKHTNEVMVSIGADYFAKCTLSQAEILRQHRIKDAQSKVDMFKKGQEYLQNQLSFRKDTIFDNAGQEIVEVYSEEEDKEWRLKHRENLRNYMKSKKEKKDSEDVTDEELWNRLEELELQEELENELKDNPPYNNKPPDSTLQQDVCIPNLTVEYQEVSKKVLDKDIPKEEMSIRTETAIRPAQTSKLNLLQQVIDRQNELGEKLQELKHKERNRSKTENDLMSRLDELEQLDELEDEMDRLDDIIEGEEVDSDEDDNSTSSLAPIIKRQVSFADEDDSETIEITFKHSDVPPSTDIYDPSKGIQKPSDIYSAYTDMFTEPTSILKKTKFSDTDIDYKTVKQDSPIATCMQTEDDEESVNINSTIVVRDVMERTDQNGNMMENTESRPMSLFKKKRMQNK